MKKDIVKSLTAGLLLSSTLGMAACGQIKIDDYNVTSGTTYLVYDQFKADQLSLELELSDGTTKTVSVTADMIKEMPDMSTPGEKTVIILYEGVEYSFKFNVEGKTNEEMLALIESFMQDYDKVNNPGNIKANIRGSYSAKYWGDSYTENLEEAEFEIAKEDLPADRLINGLYSSIVGGLVESAGNINTNNIVHSSHLKSKVALIDALKKIGEGVQDIDYVGWILHDLVSLIDEEEEDTIWSMMQESLSLSVSATNSVERLLKTNWQKLVKGEELDDEYWKSQVNEFTTIVANNTTDNDVKSIVTEANTLIQAEESNIVSKYLTDIKDIIDLSDVYEEVEDDYGNIVKQYPINDETDEIESRIDNNIIGIVETIENISEENLEDSLNTISVKLQAILDEQLVLDAKGWKVDLLMFRELSALESLKDYVDKVAGNVDAYKENIRRWYADVVKGSMLTEIILDVIRQEIIERNEDSEGFDPDETEHQIENPIPERVEKVISALVYDLIVFEKNSIDYVSYIEASVEGVYGEDESVDSDALEEKKEYYIQQYESQGYITLFSDKLQEAYDDPEAFESWQIERKKSIEMLIEIIKQAEKITQYHWTSDEEYSYDYATLFNLTNAFAEQQKKAFAEEYQYYLDDEYTHYDEDDLEEDVRWMDFLGTLTKVGEEGEIDLRSNTQKAIQIVKQDIEDALTYDICYHFVGWDDESEELHDNGYDCDACQDIRTEISLALDKYIALKEDEQYPINDVISSFAAVVDKHFEEPSRVLFNAISLCAMVQYGAQEDADLNEVFKNFKLDDRIESIDYNAFVEKVLSEQTYEDMLKVSDVNVKYETNAQGEIVREIMTIDVVFNYDILVAGLGFNAQIEMVIDF